MATWGDFETDTAGLAAFAKSRMMNGPVYLATTDAGGWPRVHPVSAIIGHGRMFVFMFDASPKGKDLRRDGRYALHCTVENNAGGEGEVFVRGAALLIDDPAVRKLAVEIAPYKPRDEYILFQMDVDHIIVTTYDGEDSDPVRKRWNAKRV